MFHLAPGIASAIESCARQDPQVAALQDSVFRRQGYLALALLATCGITAAAGALVRIGQLPVWPTVIVVNLVAILVPFQLTLLLLRYVRSVTPQLSDAVRKLAAGYAGFRLRSALLWNRCAVGLSLIFVLVTNAPFFGLGTTIRLSPYIVLALIPITYCCAGYYCYVSALIAAAIAEIGPSPSDLGT
jgi:hypothetical protein